MWFQNRTLDQRITLTGGASTTVTLQNGLPRDRWIRAIMLHTQIVESNNSAGIATGLLNFHKAIRVVASGNDTLKNVNGYRLWAVNKYEHGCQLPFDTIGSLDTGLTKNAYFELHFALNPKNPFDVSALLPAHLLSTLDLFIDLDALTTMGAGFTLTSGYTEVTVTECYTAADEENSIKKNLVKLYEVENVYSSIPSAVVSDYSQYIDLQTGVRIQKIGVFTQTSSAYSNGVVSKYEIRQMSPVNTQLNHSEWYASQAEDKIFYGLTTNVATGYYEGLETGFTIYDPEFKSGFLDTTGMKQGDIRIRFNTLVSSGAVILYYKYFI